MSLSWFVVQSKSNREDALYQQLVAKNFEVFYPSVHVSPVNPRSRKIKPYFPGYMFVKANLDQTGLSMLQYCPFSKGPVSFDQEPAPVVDELIDAIRRKVGEINAGGGEIYIGLEKGSHVRIQSGPFAGYDAIFDEKISGHERVRVLLLLLNDRRMRLELQIDQIHPEVERGKP